MAFQNLFRFTSLMALLWHPARVFANSESEGGLRNNGNSKKEDAIFNNKVKIELYYLPQCPGCRQLLTTSFYDAFHTEGFSDMADVTFVPYGNARKTIEGDRVFDNVLESCALQYIGSDHQDQQFQYIDCIDHHPKRQNPETAAMVDVYCARAIGLKPEIVRKINTCASSEEGHALSRKMIQLSDSLTPRMSYFPWLIVDGVHDEHTEDTIWKSLFLYVCRIYDNGPSRSPMCPPLLEELEGDTL